MSHVPLFLRVAAGLVVTAAERVRKLPEQLTELPVTAASRAVQTGMRLQQRVTELAVKGDEVFALFRPVEDTPPWARFDEDELAEPAEPTRRGDTAEEEPGGPLAPVVPGPGVGRDTAAVPPPDAGEPDEGDVAKAASPGTARGARGRSRDRSPEPVPESVEQAAEKEAERAPGEVVEKAARKAGEKGRTRSSSRTAGTRSSRTSRTSGTSSARKAATSSARTGGTARTAGAGRTAGGSGRAGSGTPAPSTSNGTRLPLAGYDELTLAQLRGKLRSLSVAELEQLLDYEQSHADRAPFVTMLANRITTVRTR